jgi:hypothetical protein
VNIVIPMAGRGQRFADAGYTLVVPGTDDHWNLDPWTVRMPGWAAEALIEKGRTEAAAPDAELMKQAFAQVAPLIEGGPLEYAALLLTAAYNALAEETPKP